MTSFLLKLVALITMTIDHIGMFIFPGNPIFRIIGRIAFPIFAFLIVEGYKHTKSFPKYVTRILVLGVISQILFFIFLKETTLNILFTLGIALLALKSFEKKEYIITLLLIYLSIICDYPLYGIILILLFYILRNNFLYTSLSFLFLNFIFINILKLFYPIQYYSLLSLIFIYFYNGKEGKKIKPLFYIYYPVHYLLLGLIGKIL